MTRAPLVVLLLAALALPAHAVAADPPVSKPLATVSPPSGIPFMTPAGTFAFDTGDYLLAGSDGLARARGLFTMGRPGGSDPLDSSPVAPRGHRFGRLGHWKR